MLLQESWSPEQDSATTHYSPAPAAQLNPHANDWQAAPEVAIFMSQSVALCIRMFLATAAGPFVINPVSAVASRAW